MRRPVAHALRIATVVVFTAVALLGVFLLVRGSDPPKKPEIASSTAGAMSVNDAVNFQQSTDPVSVRGYLFDGGGTGTRLCYRRIPSKPPMCKGPYLDLRGVDKRSMTFRTGKSLGRPVRWVDAPVVVFGHLDGTGMDVQEISR